MMNKEFPLCECGCGKRVSKAGNKYIHGHSGGRPHNLSKSEFCKCGCGEYAKPGRDYIAGHQRRRDSYWKKQRKSKLCKCGCGKLAKPGNDYINFHDNRGVPHSKSHSEAVAKTKRGISLSEDHRKSISDALVGGSVFHHYIYDHANPKLYTMKITRVKHNQIHKWMNRANIKVPHINIKEESV